MNLKLIEAKDGMATFENLDLPKENDNRFLIVHVGEIVGLIVPEGPMS